MKTKAVVGTLLLLIACVGGLVLFNADSRDGSSMPVNELEDQASYESSQEDSVPRLKSFVEVDVAPESATSPLFLGKECPELLDESVADDEVCLDAVERHFMDRPVYNVRFGGIVSRDSPFSFRSMFQNHMNDLRLVTEALSRPECRLLEGPIRLDLRETCNAESFFRFTYFSSVCRHAALWRENFEPLSYLETEASPYEKNLSDQRLLISEESAELGVMSRYQYKLEESKAISAFDDSMYYKWRNSERKALLRDVWLDTSGRCPSYVVDGSLSPLDNDTSNVELLNWWSEGAKVFWRARLQRYADTREFPPGWAGSVEDPEPYELLQSIAARLGSEWNLIVRNYVVGAFMDEKFMKSKQEFLNWKSQIGEAFRNIPNKREQVVLNVVQGIVGLREAGYEADIEYIARSLCEVGPEWKERGVKDCATAIRDAETKLDPQDIVSLRILDEVEAAALKLSDYQYF